MIQRMANWLQTYPLWEGKLTVDYLGSAPGSVGLYPAGVEELDRREDVAGNVTASCRCLFDLRRVTTGQQDCREHAQRLLDFCQWVNRQSRMGLAPKFGDEPARERIRAEKGKLQSASQTGTATYTVRLTAEYVIKGENDHEN